MATLVRPRRRAAQIRRPNAKSPPSGVPYTMRLADGTSLFVEVPARMAEADRSGQVAFTPQGVAFLDRVRALASRMPSPPSPAYLATLREALGMTQEQLGKAIGRDKLTISRWERGTFRPSPEALGRLDALARKCKRAGVRLVD